MTPLDVGFVGYRLAEGPDDENRNELDDLVDLCRTELPGGNGVCDGGFLQVDHLDAGCECLG
jgi:hypothetical protein